MNRKYLNYLIRERKIVLIFFFILYAGISMTPYLQGNGSVGNDMPGRIRSSLLAAFVLSIGMTYLLPILTFAFIHRRRSADVYLALPISRSSQLLTGLLFCWGVPTVFFIACTFLSVLVGHSAVTPAMIGYFALAVFYAAVILAELTLFHTALFLLANNLFDGFVMVAVYTALPVLLEVVCIEWADAMIVGNAYESSLPMMVLSPVGMSFTNFDQLITRMTQDAGTQISWLYLALPVLYAAAAAFLLKKHFVNRQSERAEQVSDDPLAYPAAIHICLFLMLLVISANAVANSVQTMLLPYILMLAAYVVSMFVYRRRIRLEVRSILLYCGMVLLTVGIAASAWKTRGFSLADRYPLEEGDVTVYEYSASSRGPRLDRMFEEDRFLDGGEYCYISFSLEVPRGERSAFQEAVDILDAYRKERIDAYYSREGKTEAGYLSVCGRVGIAPDPERNWRMIDNHDYPTGSRLLTEEELIRISRYTDVFVSCEVRNGEAYDYVEYSLAEYLAVREGGADGSAQAE